MSTTVRIDTIGTLKRVTAPFNEALRTLHHMGTTQIVSFRDIARARLQAGYGHLLFKADAFSREAVIYTASNTTYFVRTSPLLDVDLADKVAAVHRKLETLNDTGDPAHHSGLGEIMFGEVLDMQLFEDIVHQAEEDKGKPVEMRRVLIHQGSDVAIIPTDKFGSHDLTVWLYGPTAQEYGMFLRKRRIFSCMVWLVDWLNPDPARRPFIRQLVMNGGNGDINGGRRFGWDDGHMGGTWGVFQ